MDLSTRKIQPITKDFHPTVSPLQWNHGDGCIYFNTDDGDCKNIYRYSPKDGKFEKLNLETDVTSAFAWMKVFGNRLYLAGTQIHNKGLSIEIIGNRVIATKQLLLTGSPEAFGGIGKNCGNHPIANDFDTQAFPY